MDKFLDSSVFLHAYLRPNRQLSEKEKIVKRAASAILERVEKGEKVVTSVVQLSEILNIVEARLGLEKALDFLEHLLTMENVDMIAVSRQSYEVALAITSRYPVSPNDAIAFLLSRGRGAAVYSFDKHFDNLPEVIRVSK